MPISGFLNDTGNGQVPQRSGVERKTAKRTSPANSLQSKPGPYGRGKTSRLARRYQRFVEGLGDRFIFFSHTVDSGELVFLSGAVEKILGITQKELTNRTWQSIDWLPGVESTALAKLQALLSDEIDSLSHEMSFNHPDGSVRTIRVSEHLVNDEKEGVLVEGIAEDITEAKKLADEMRFLATHDSLTGLRSRHQLEQLLKKEISRSARYQHHFSVMMLDFDDFKTVNDQYGHMIGDAVLKESAQIILDTIRETDTAIRYAGDEFFLVMAETSLTRAMKLAERVQKRIKQHSITIDSNERVRITTSIGIAGYPQHATAWEDLVRIADKALYDAKKLGKCRICIPSTG